jgi:signal peptide peptidase SppA
MNYPRIFERMYCQPLLVTRERFLAAHQVLLPRVRGGMDSSLEAALIDTNVALPNRDGTGRRQQRAYPTVDPYTGRVVDPALYTMAKPGVAVVPIYGVLAKNLSAFEESCGGGTDVNPIAHALAQAAADPEVSKIVLDIDSPGGEVTGIPELGSRIRSIAAAGKPVIAFSDATTASAAYWLASQAGEFYVTPSSRQGSIGVYAAWLDETVALEMKGYSLELFAAGKHKAMGMPFRGLTDEERDMLQANVEAIYEDFKGAVLSSRPGVVDATMQGQMFRARESVSNRLADGIVADWEEFVELV